MQPKLLLHVCCAPCATHPIEELKEEYDISLFFYNPNIYPTQEYEKRLMETIILSKALNLPIIKTEHEQDKWNKAVKGHEQDPEGGERCNICYEFRLRKTAEHAKTNGFQFFTTTLTVSPYKDSNEIFEIARKIEQEIGIKFLDINFKKQDGYKKSIDHSKKHNLYRQKYCGCIYSLKQEKLMHFKDPSGI